MYGGGHFVSWHSYIESATALSNRCVSVMKICKMPSTLVSQYDKLFNKDIWCFVVVLGSASTDQLEYSIQTKGHMAVAKTSVLK